MELYSGLLDDSSTEELVTVNDQPGMDNSGSDFDFGYYTSGPTSEKNDITKRTVMNKDDDGLNKTLHESTFISDEESRISATLENQGQNCSEVGGNINFSAKKENYDISEAIKSYKSLKKVQFVGASSTEEEDEGNGHLEAKDSEFHDIIVRKHIVPQKPSEVRITVYRVILVR